MSPSAEPEVDARRSRPTSATTSTSTKANQILDDAGYKDTDGDGIREMPGGGKPLNFRYVVPLRVDVLARRSREFITGWLKEIGIGTTVDGLQTTRS